MHKQTTNNNNYKQLQTTTNNYKHKQTQTNKKQQQLQTTTNTTHKQTRNSNNYKQLQIQHTNKLKTYISSKPFMAMIHRFMALEDPANALHVCRVSRRAGQLPLVWFEKPKGQPPIWGVPPTRKGHVPKRDSDLKQRCFLRPSKVAKSEVEAFIL